MLLALVLALALSPSSPASVNAPLLATSVHLTSSAQQDILFLDRNLENCTRFASLIRERVVAPISSDLQNFQIRLARYNEQPPRSCSSRADLDFIIGTIAAKLAAASAKQSELMGMSGDEAMTKALSTDDSHPNCRAEDPRDPKSTRELKAYLGLKLKLIALKGAVAALKNQTVCAK